MTTRRGLAASVGPLAALALILGFFFLARSFGSDAEALGPFPNAVPNKGVTATVVAPTLAQPPAAPSPLSPASPFAQPTAPPGDGTTTFISARPGSGAPFRPGFGSAVGPSTPFPKPTASTPAEPEKPGKPTKSAKPKKHAKHGGKADKPAKTHGPKADKPKKSGPSQAAKPEKENKGHKGKKPEKANKPEKAAKPEKTKGGKSKKH